MPRLHIHPSFFVILPLSIVLDFWGQFFILLGFALLHELSHCFMAYRLGLKIQKITLTPLGLMAHLRGFHHIRHLSRLKILWAGPLCNLFFFYLFVALEQRFLWQVNLGLFLFNLLPIYPLDGGQLVLSSLSYRYGLLKGHGMSQRISRWMGHGLFVFGLVQSVLFFNFGLLLLYYYLKQAGERQQIELIYCFYSLILKGYKVAESVPVAVLVAASGESLREILAHCHPERQLLVFYTPRSGQELVLSEQQLLQVVN